MSKVIAITYEKGGCGKTTTAVNLSAILAELGHKVLLVDLDKQAYATNYFDLYNEKNNSIFEIMERNISPDTTITKTPFDNLYIIPAARRLSNIEKKLIDMGHEGFFVLKQCLKPIRNNFDFIIMDCPPSGEKIKENALTASDYVILPVIPDDFAIPGLIQITQEILEIRKTVNPNLSTLGILITLFERTKNKIAYTQAFKEQKNVPCLNTVIRKNATLSEAINHHKPINKYKKSCNGYKDYFALTQEILDKLRRD